MGPIDGRYEPESGRLRNAKLRQQRPFRKQLRTSPLGESELSLPANFSSDRNCHSTRAAPLVVRWAAKEEQADFYFLPGQGSCFDRSVP
jgi:hypothetical protein